MIFNLLLETSECVYDVLFKIVVIANMIYYTVAILIVHFDTILCTTLYARHIQKLTTLISMLLESRHLFLAQCYVRRISHSKIYSLIYSPCIYGWVY